MKPTIDLKPIIHKNVEQIGIYFKNDLNLNILTRKNAGAVWSQTKKCWYIPSTRNAFEKLKAAVKGYAEINTTELKKYLEEKKKTIASNQLVLKSRTIIKQTAKIVSDTSMVNRHVLPAMKQYISTAESPDR